MLFHAYSRCQLCCYYNCAIVLQLGAVAPKRVNEAPLTAVARVVKAVCVGAPKMRAYRDACVPEMLTKDTGASVRQGSAMWLRTRQIPSKSSYLENVVLQPMVLLLFARVCSVTSCIESSVVPLHQLIIKHKPPNRTNLLMVLCYTIIYAYSFR